MFHKFRAAAIEILIQEVSQTWGSGFWGSELGYESLKLHLSAKRANSESSLTISPDTLHPISNKALQALNPKPKHAEQWNR